MAQIDYSSIPAWARPSAQPAAGPLGSGGTSYLLVGAGPHAIPVLDGWERELGAEATVRREHADTVAQAQSLLRAALSTATVGVRVCLTGPAGACLVLRGVAAAAGLEDDEVFVTPAGPGPVDVFCAHCGGVTPVHAQVDDVVACAGCHRDLLVYHHVSRLTGQYLGFMVDAEDPVS